MTAVHRLTATLVAVLAALLLVAGPVPEASAAEEPVGGNDRNEAVAVNTEDGASLFRLAFSIARVTDGTVDQENLAVAYASCTDCRTVALAFQVVIVVGDADYVAPVNQAGALNDQCAECLTFASATQIVIRVDGPVVLTPEGWRRLAILAKRMRDLEGQIDQLSPAQLAAEVSSIEQELITILDEELVPDGAPPGGDRDPGAGTGATTTTAPSTTSTTDTASATPTTTAPITTVTTAPSTPPGTDPATPVTTASGG